MRSSGGSSSWSASTRCVTSVTPKQIPLASLPLLFGLHQLSEAFVWWGLQGDVAHAVERVALWAYLLFAFAALPVLIPVAVGLIERSPVAAADHRRVRNPRDRGRRRARSSALFRGPIHTVIDGRHIAYDVDALHLGAQLTALYVIATCGALLACSYRDIAAIGALNLVVVPVLMWLTINGFVSLWCFWAAIVSILIARHLRQVAMPRLPVPV